MVEQPVGMPDARVTWDLATDGWVVRRGGRSWLVRRWTWGERRRLLQWAAPGGRLHGGRFVQGLLALLVRPARGEPPSGGALRGGARAARRRPALIEGQREPAALRDDDRDWLASVALELLGVLPGTPVVPIADAERAAAVHLGWGPLELDRQPLPAVEELLAGLVQPASPPADDGWNRIVVDDG